MLDFFAEFDGEGPRSKLEQEHGQTKKKNESNQFSFRLDLVHALSYSVTTPFFELCQKLFTSLFASVLVMLWLECLWLVCR